MQAYTGLGEEPAFYCVKMGKLLEDFILLLEAIFTKIVRE